MNIVRAEIATLGFEDAEIYAVTIEYKSRAKRTYTAVVIADLNEKTAYIAKDNGMPANYKPDYITDAVSHILNVWKMDMLDSLCPFPIVVK